MLFHWSKKRLPLRTAYIFLVTLWISFEKFHLEWDFSWPWLNLGNVFSEDIQWIQWYEYTGSFGGSLWVLLINIGLFEVLKNHKASLKKTVWVKKNQSLANWDCLTHSPYHSSFSKEKKRRFPQQKSYYYSPTLTPTMKNTKKKTIIILT